MRVHRRSILHILFVWGILPFLWSAEPHWAGAQESSQPPSIHYVTPATVKSWLDEGQRVTFLDVREADEFAAGHLPGAINVVSSQITTIASQLPQDQPIVIYCIHSAHRAPEAVRMLRQLGVDHAYVLEGGIVTWETGGLTILASDPKQSPTVLPVTDRCANLQK